MCSGKGRITIPYEMVAPVPSRAFYGVHGLGGDPQSVVTRLDSDLEGHDPDAEGRRPSTHLNGEDQIAFKLLQNGTRRSPRRLG